MINTDGISESESVDKDTNNSPGSARETRELQSDSVSTSKTAREDDVDESQVHVLPGTGGPDDVGDIEVDPSELNLSGKSIPGHPKPGSADS